MAASEHPSSPSQNTLGAVTGDAADQEEENDLMEESELWTPEPQDSYRNIAQAVAALLSPTITAAVDRVVVADILQLRKGAGITVS